jgi:hypothetical protein
VAHGGVLLPGIVSWGFFQCPWPVDRRVEAALKQHCAFHALEVTFRGRCRLHAMSFYPECSPEAFEQNI